MLKAFGYCVSMVIFVSSISRIPGLFDTCGCEYATKVLVMSSTFITAMSSVRYGSTVLSTASTVVWWLTWFVLTAVSSSIFLRRETKCVFSDRFSSEMSLVILSSKNSTILGLECSLDINPSKSYTDLIVLSGKERI